MKLINLSIFLVFFTLFLSCNSVQTEPKDEIQKAPENNEFYQLKIYSFDTNEQLELTDEYLKNAFLPGLKKLGIDKIGVFKSRAKEIDTLKKIYVLIPFTSLDHYFKLEEELTNDTDYLTNGNAFITAAHDAPTFNRYESILLKHFEDFPLSKVPSLATENKDRVYELRSYESATDALYRNKVHMFNAGGEIKLFDRLEFNAVFYGEVISGSKMPNLMYMTTFSNMESREAHWKSFVDSPEWNKLKVDSMYSNNVSHIDIDLLYPTSYSDY